MMKPIVLQHHERSPAELIFRICEDPEFSDPTERKFYAQAKKDEKISSVFQGRDFVYGPENVPKAGLITSLIVYVSGNIAAQLLFCRITIEALLGVIANVGTCSPDEAFAGLGIGEFDLYLMR